MNKKISLLSLMIATSFVPRVFGGGPDDHKHPEQAGAMHTPKAKENLAEEPAKHLSSGTGLLSDQNLLSDLSKLPKPLLENFFGRLEEAALDLKAEHRDYLTSVLDLRSKIDTNNKELDQALERREILSKQLQTHKSQKKHDEEFSKLDEENFVYEFTDNTVDQDIKATRSKIAEITNSIKTLVNDKEELVGQIPEIIVIGRDLDDRDVSRIAREILAEAEHSVTRLYSLK